MIADRTSRLTTHRGSASGAEPQTGRTCGRRAARGWLPALARRTAAGAFCLALAACGGGGAGGTGGTGGTIPDPAVPTGATKTLANSGDDARALAGAVVAGDGDVASAGARAGRVGGSGGVGLIAPTASAPGGLAAGGLLKATLGSAGRVAKVSEVLPCLEIYPLGSTLDVPGDVVTGCSGTVTLTAPDGLADADSLPVGSVFSMVFNTLSVTGSLSGTTQIGGTLSMTVIQTLDTSGGSLTGGVRITATNLVGLDDGLPFGPESFTLDMTFSAGGVTLLIDGERITGLETRFTDDDNFTVVSGSALTEVDGGYVWLDFSDWQVVDGIPQPGSSLTVRDATGGTATILVTQSTATGATMTVTIVTAAQGSGSHVVQVLFNGGEATVI